MDNQRTRLTIRLIREAFLDILREGGMQKATVSAICERAQINRSTFYRYFENQFQLLEQYEDELISELEDHHTDFMYGDTSEPSRQRTYDTMLDMFETIRNRIDEYYVLTACVEPNIFQRSRALRMDAAVEGMSSSASRSQAEYLGRFLVSGGQRVVSAWICKGDERESPEQMANLLVNMTYSLLAGFESITKN